MVIISGASDGLGRELAALFVQEGVPVIGLCRSPCADGVTHIPTDLADSASIANAVSTILKMQTLLSALINCAGALSVEKIDSLTIDQVDRVLDLNIRAPLLLTSGLMERIKRDGADIVNVSSSVGTKAYPQQAAYGASKWALRGFSANLQVELKDFPCRVISFCPGGFKSKLFEKATGVDNTADGAEWMTALDVARCLKQTLDLPKNMEVTEIVLNRKSARKR